LHTVTPPKKEEGRGLKKGEKKRGRKSVPRFQVYLSFCRLPPGMGKREGEEKRTGKKKKKSEKEAAPCKFLRRAQSVKEKKNGKKKLKTG